MATRISHLRPKGIDKMVLTMLKPHETSGALPSRPNALGTAGDSDHPNGSRLAPDQPTFVGNSITPGARVMEPKSMPRRLSTTLKRSVARARNHSGILRFFQQRKAKREFTNMTVALESEKVGEVRLDLDLKGSELDLKPLHLPAPDVDMKVDKKEVKEAKVEGMDVKVEGMDVEGKEMVKETPKRKSVSKEEIPYWCNNLPPDQWPSECPDWLVDISEKNKGILMVRDEEFIRSTWEEVKAIVASGNVASFRRVPTDLRNYLYFRTVLIKSCGSLTNYILWRRLYWKDLTPRSTTPFEYPEDYKILLNDHPYGVDPRIVHLVVWVKFPLHDGIEDDQYIKLFKDVIGPAVEIYRPTAIVLQCGADSLGGDRLGCFNLNIKAHGACVEYTKKFGLPLLLLGGGGYTARNVARLWAYETSLAIGTEDIDPALPAHMPFLDHFSPDKTLFPPLSELNKRFTNANSKSYVESLVRGIRESLRYVQGAPSVQMTQVPNNLDKWREELEQRRREEEEEEGRGRRRKEEGRGTRGELARE